MDLAKITMHNTARVELIHPTKGATGVFLTIRAPHHPEVKAALHRIADSRNTAMLKRRTFKAEQLEEDGLTLLVASIEGWEGLEKDGKPFPFTAENARVLLGETWIQRQVAEAAEDVSLFFPAE